MRLKWIVHPFLFALYPAVALLAVNIVWVPVGEAARAMLASLALCLLLFAGLSLLVRQPYKAGLITSVLLVSLFSYGHVYGLLRDLGLHESLGRHRYLAPMTGALLLLAILAVLRTKRELKNLTRLLNYVAVFSLILPLFTVARYEIERLRTPPSVHTTDQFIPGLQLPADAPPPDIYLIILDAYAREDILHTVFNYDNAETLDALRDLGFYVADRSRANHAQTSLSLAALLNMDYVPALLPDANPDSVNREPLWQLIQHSRVRRALEELGYTTVAFSTGLHGTEIRDADIFLTTGTLDQALGLRGINAFEGMLVEGSAGKLLTDLSIALPRSLPDLQYPYRLHRDRINNIFDQLEALPETQGPKFVFAHVIAPHPPFVFGPNGEAVKQDQPYTLGDAGMPIADSEYIGAYRDQVRYVDKRLLQTVRAILANSERPPIIIVQADHGPEGRHASVSYPQERMTILNAIYLPGGDGGSLYEDITPVNTFRLILQRYFQADIPLLPDRVLYSQYRQPYQFIDLTDSIE